MSGEPAKKQSFLGAKIATITIVVIYTISIIGGIISRAVYSTPTGSSCTIEKIMSLDNECLKWWWTQREHNGRLDMVWALLDVASITLMIPVLNGFKKLVKDKTSGDFMIAVLFNFVNTIFQNAAREWAAYRTHTDLKTFYPDFELAFRVNSDLLSWVGSIDELLYGIVFLYLAALGSSTKIFPKGFNVTSLILGTLSLLAFVAGILYLLWDGFIFAEFIIRVIYMITLYIWLFWGFYFFRTMA
ncbi:hypothetical protein WA158_003876 [Blastocystis sp. Blastoise]